MPCKLCFNASAPVRESHIVGRGFHRRALKFHPDGPAPDLQCFDTATGKSFFGNKPLVDDLLCDGCEVLMKREEDYILTHLTQIGGARPWVEGAPVDLPRVARFVVGVAYRFAVSRHHTGRKLDPYEPRLAAYLRGEAEMPDGIYVNAVALEKVASSLIVFPCASRHKTHTQYQFVVLGVAFFLHVGLDTPRAFNANCLHRGGKLLHDVNDQLLSVFSGDILNAKATRKAAEWHAAQDSQQPLR